MLSAAPSANIVLDSLRYTNMDTTSPPRIADSSSDASQGLLFVSDVAAGTVGEYSTSGQTVNASLISGLDSPYAIAVSGSNLFVSSYNDPGTIGEYTTTGATVNASLITGLHWPEAIAIVGSNLFIAQAGAGDGATGLVGEYTTSGATINASLITGLNGFEGIAISGSDLFIANNNTQSIEEYTTAGVPVNTSFVSDDENGPTGLAVSGSNLIVADLGAGVLEYTMAGTLDPNFGIPAKDPSYLAISGSDLYVAQGTTSNYVYSASEVDEYTLTGAPVSTPLISGFRNIGGIAIESDSSTSQPPANGLVDDSLLSVTISGHLPISALTAGAKFTPFKQTVHIVNSSTSAVNGDASISLLLSPDPTGESGGVTDISIHHKVNLKPGKYVNLPITIRTLPSGATGTMYVLPVVTDPNGDTAFSATAATISILPAYVDLSPTAVRGPATVKGGDTGTVLVTVINDGTAPATGNLSVDLKASATGIDDANSIDLGTFTRHVSIQAGRKTTLQLKESFPATGGPYYLLVTVDPQNTFGESKLTDKVLTSLTAVRITG